MIKTGLFFLLLFFGVAAQAQTVPSWRATRLKEYMMNSDSVLVINFWATFCKPCNEEIPYFQSTIDKFKDQKVKLVLVSLDLKDDYPAKIRTFAKQNNYYSDVVWLNETNADYFCPMVDKSWTGGIPSTLIINPKKGYRKFFEKQLKKEDLESELLKALN
jgi:peroxiredoxin